MDKQEIKDNISNMLFGKKQSDICKKTGISQSRLSEFANGHSLPTLEQAAALADFLEISIDDLIGHKTAEKTGVHSMADVLRCFFALDNACVISEISIDDLIGFYFFEPIAAVIYEYMQLKKALKDSPSKEKVLSLWIKDALERYTDYDVNGSEKMPF